MLKTSVYRNLFPSTEKMELGKNWDQSRIDYYLHRARVHDAKPLVDNKPPLANTHVRVNQKKLQMMAEIKARIERGNCALVEKMAQIMSSKGQIDHINNYQHRSLNMKQRQRELIRITVDNQAILKRIQSREPTYNHRQWLSQWHANRSYVANVSKYSHLWNQDNVPPMWLTHKLKQSAPKTSI